MKKLIQAIISMPFLAIILLIYAASMGVATFIENDYGPAISKYYVYNTWWFELIHILLVINFIGNIFKYKLYKTPKWSILLFHLAFIFIIIGAGITRYAGFEGTIRIREGESENKILTEKNYLVIKHSKSSDSTILKHEQFISPAIENKYNTSFTFNEKPYQFEIVQLIPNAVKSLKADPNGSPIMEIVVGTEFGMQSYYINHKSHLNFHNKIFSLNESVEADSTLQFTNESNNLFVLANMEIKRAKMKGDFDTIYPAGTKIMVKPYQWYAVGNRKFVVTSFFNKGKITYIQGKPEEQTGLSILECKLQSENESSEIFLPYLNNMLGEEVIARINNEEFKVSYGASELELPFALKLRDFQLERYPGSQSPSSFASEVTLIDSNENITKDYRIFMNNILEHKGYRFYQSSYDTDEKGTILSVNHDKPGTYTSYFGYLLLVIGMIWSMFAKSSYFAELNKKSKELRKKRDGLITSLLILSMLAVPQLSNAQHEHGEGVKTIDKAHAKHFGRILVQDNAGRIEPFNSLNSELLRKISRQEKINGLDHNQVIMGMMFNPMYWQKQPLIKIGHPDLMRMLGTDKKLVPFDQFVNLERSEYILKEYVTKAFEKQPGERDKFDKEMIAVDERVNIVYQIFTGQFMKIFPTPGDLHATWMIPSESKKIKDAEAAKFASNVFSSYYEAIVHAEQSKNWKEADLIVDSIIAYQKTHAAEILPSDLKIKMEIQYVNMDIFNRLFKYFGAVGLIFLIFLFAAVVKPTIKTKKPTLVFGIILGILFLAQTYGLGIRWYISGHAPWSNGYESMIYISWATMLAGFLFVKRSPIVLAATALLASITLMVAHLSWMDPQISNLVPVLKSYWLTIHVSVITASYGFLGLSALLGLLNQLIMIMKTSVNKLNLNETIEELSLVNHKTMIIGLYLLTIGTFLGAVWANESWGRYWGWDPKETWALISVIVYTFVLHTRFIPSLNNRYTFNLLSLLGFSSILMTYFGVNYYLSGLHSYAQGDPVPVPSFVYVAIVIVLVVGVLAYFRNRMADMKNVPSKS